MNKQEIIELLKSVLKEIYPQGKTARKARVVKTYAAGDSYYADVEILKNDGTPDENEPQVNGVEIPLIWAGVERGVICPPQAGMFCDIEYYAGDPDYPRISNFRPQGKVPAAEPEEFVLQQSPAVFFKIRPDGSYEIAGNNLKIALTGDAEITADGNIKAAVSGTAEVKAAGKAVVKSDEKIEIDAPVVSFCGASAATGAIGVGSPCPLTATHQKGSAKVFIDGK